MRRTGSLTSSILMLGGGQKKKSKYLFKNSNFDNTENLGASVAQMEVAQALEPALDDEDEFLKLFMDGTEKGNDQSFEDYPDAGANTGAVAMKQMMQRPQQFVIEMENNADGTPNIQNFQYTEGDPIFKLSCANDVANSVQNPFCNCCKEKYKSYKDARYCQFCALAFCAKCRFKTRIFPQSVDMSRGDVCKVCDRKFFIKEMIKDKQI